MIDDASGPARCDACRLLLPWSAVPVSVWSERVPLVDGHFTRIMPLSMSMRPQPMLTDATGRQRTVIGKLAAGDNTLFLTVFRWHAIPSDMAAARTNMHVR